MSDHGADCTIKDFSGKIRPGVPRYHGKSFGPREHDYALLIPVRNEGERIITELTRAKKARLSRIVDIVLLDGGSTDGSTEEEGLRALEVNTLLVQEEGRQGAAFRMGFHWAMERGYEGVVTVDGNNKDSIEDVPRFIRCLEEGYDFVQGSRFHREGTNVRTPRMREWAIRFLHAPLVSRAAGFHYTDTTNAFRAYSRRYLTDPEVAPLRDEFDVFEILVYLSSRAPRLGFRTLEIPVTRTYPESGEVPTQVRMSDHFRLFRDLISNLRGEFDPPKAAEPGDEPQNSGSTKEKE